MAFTANLVTGADEVVVSAVRGLGERLVSGEADPDEWVVRGDHLTSLRAPEGSLREDQALRVADAARRAAVHFGFPLDIEWAFEDERLVAAGPPHHCAPGCGWPRSLQACPSAADLTKCNARQESAVRAAACAAG